MPLTDVDQECLEYRLETNPTARVFSYSLPTGEVHYFNILAPHMSLTVSSEATVVTHHRDTFEGLQFLYDDFAFYRSPAVQDRYMEYLMPTGLVEIHAETDSIANEATRQMGVGAASFLVSLTRVLNREIEFKPGITGVDSTSLQVLEHRSGVCQDFTHLMLAVCRRQGIPARYISGYLYNGVDHSISTETTEISIPTDAAEIVGAEERFEGKAGASLLGANAMHAWVECLLPCGRWIGFDPTNNLLTNHHFIKVSYGRDYKDVAPLRGIYRGPLAHTMTTSVTVTEHLL